eukprot:TRINITY_DN11601_c0_g1_i1.p1 TRINITY_DN11601_c0_g1~~TRINITY_DN11601_c0_g1_i1.p1  ORF type:complete len:119 (-),score=32.79 TRINITY_DN11601_c0_g1_i1:127-483(-)
MSVLSHFFNKLDYAAMGFLMLGLGLSAFTTFYQKANSKVGRAVLGCLLCYFYLRWQIDVTQIPMKVDDYAKCWDRVDFFRATRDAYLEFSCLLLALFNFAVAKYRGDIEELESKLKQQ